MKLKPPTPPRPIIIYTRTTPDVRTRLQVLAEQHTMTIGEVIHQLLEQAINEVETE